MRRFLLILFGAVIGTIAMVLAVYAFGLLAVWSPFPRRVWATHGTVVLVTSAFLAFAPFIAVLAVVLTRLFQVNAVSSAFLSMGLVVVATNLPNVHDVHGYLTSLIDGWWLIASFLFGVPLLVAIFTNLRSNNRWSGRAA